VLAGRQAADGLHADVGAERDEADRDEAGGAAVVGLGAGTRALTAEPPGQRGGGGDLHDRVEPEADEADRPGGDAGRQRDDGLGQVPGEGDPVEDPSPVHRSRSIEGGGDGGHMQET
jgi:hypothetical protein